MKVVVYKCGLGNQLFEYVFSQYLKRRYFNDRIYALTIERKLHAHNGFELSKWFDVDLKRTPFWIKCYVLLILIVRGILLKFHVFIKVINTEKYFNNRNFIYEGYWQDKKYMLSTGVPSFKEDLPLSEENVEILRQIKSSNSVAIHFRRGDYISTETNRLLYGNICTEEYYATSIKMIEDKVDHPLYFVFSDDVDYVRKNVKLKNRVIVSCNKGEKSFYDMYLMSHCKHMILANSTFSCWAAYLNKNNGCVICPSRWVNIIESPSIALDSWIQVEV